MGGNGWKRVAGSETRRILASDDFARTVEEVPQYGAWPKHHGDLMIHLSPKASAVALALFEDSHTAVRISDADLAARVGLEPDTVYRALRELRDRGALRFSSTDRLTMLRDIALTQNSWVWAAARQMTLQAGA